MLIKPLRFAALTALLIIGHANASAAPSEEGTTSHAIEGAAAINVEMVNRAHHVRDVLPNELRARALFSPPSLISNAAQTLITTEDPDLAALVEQARGSTDPLVLSILANRCAWTLATDPCDAVAIAQRWVDADTQNQFAWLTLGAIQLKRHDPASKATFVRASQGSLWRDYFAEAGQYIVHILPNGMAPSETQEALRAAEFARAALLSYQPFSFVSTECKDVELIAACHRVLEVLSRDADTLMATSLAAKFSRRYGVDPQVVEERFKRYDALVTGLRLDTPQRVDAKSATRDIIASNMKWEARLSTSEAQQARIALEKAGLSYEQAASRARAERVYGRDIFPKAPRRRLDNVAEAGRLQV